MSIKKLYVYKDDTGTKEKIHLETEKAAIVDWPVPDMAQLGLISNEYIDFSLPASGGTYVAPENGWVFVRKLSGAATQEYILLVCQETQFSNVSIGTVVGSNVNVSLVVKKGQHVNIHYNLTGATQWCRFIYAGNLWQDAPSDGKSYVRKNGEWVPAKKSHIGDIYIDFPLPANTGIYVAPEDGWINVVGQYMSIYKNTGHLVSHIDTAVAAGHLVTALLPVKKGWPIRFDYTLSGATYRCKFIYADDDDAI